LGWNIRPVLLSTGLFFGVMVTNETVDITEIIMRKQNQRIKAADSLIMSFFSILDRSKWDNFPDCKFPNEISYLLKYNTALDSCIEYLNKYEKRP